MSNRRLGAKRFLRKPDFSALWQNVRNFQLPRLSKRNRKKGRLLAVASSLDTATPSPSTLPASAPRRSRVAHILLFLAWFAPIAAALVAFTVPLLGVRAYEYVMTSGYFHVREVLVDLTVGRFGDTPRGTDPVTPHHTREELMAMAGIGPGTHVLQADLEAMTAKLTASPWIRWAEVSRELPDTLVIHAIEHRPVALLAARDLYLVDEVGVPFVLAPADFAARLPVISGGSVITPELLADPSAMPAIQKTLETSLNLLSKWKAQGLSRRFPVGELRLESGGRATLVLEKKTVGEATEVALGRGPYREKLFRVEWILEHLHAAGKTAQYILLDLGDELEPGAVALGGSRVVVKTDLGTEVMDTPPIKDLGAPAANPAGNPGSAPRPHVRPAAPGDAPPAAEPVSPEPDSPEPREDVPAVTPSVPAVQDPNATPTPDDPAETPEAAPLTGGRPADDSAEEN